MMPDNSGPYADPDVRPVGLKERHARAVSAFFSYGATRGNHEGGGPGPLSDHVRDMGEVVNMLARVFPEMYR